MAKKEKNFQNGDKVVISRGDGKFFSRGSSNSVKVEILNDVEIVPGSGDKMISESDDKKQINLDTNICASCQNCVTVCPHDIWFVDGDNKNLTSIHAKQLEKCSMDLECVEKCPTGAIEIIPKFL
mgnify:FL=1